MNNLEHQQFDDNTNECLKKWYKTTLIENYDNKPQSLRQILVIIFERISKIEIQLSEQKKEIEQLKRQLSAQQQSSKITNQQNDTPSFDQTIDVFNAWSKNPGSALPSQFSYAEGDLKLREKQKIQFSSTKNASWITNRSGSIKYIFPNPNAIDQLSGKIDVLYTVTGNRRARGQNKINVQNACVIKEDGWIEYKGALNLI